MGLCLYDQYEFPWATGYFDRKPFEPLGSAGIMCADSSVPVDPTLTALLYALLDQPGWVAYGQKVMFVTHGTPKAIALKLQSRTGKALLADDLDVLIKLADSPGGEADIAKAAKHFNADKDFLEMLYDDLSSVRKNCISLLAIRACRIGNNRAYLQKLARLLNVHTISAPLQRDFFGLDTNPHLGPPPGATFDQIAAKVAKMSTPMGLPAPDRVLMTLTPMAEHKFSVTTLAESAKGMTMFLNSAFQFRMPFTTWTPRDGVVIYGVVKPGGFYVFPGMKGYAGLFVNVPNPRFVSFLPTAEVPLPALADGVTVTRREHRRMRRAAFFQKLRRAG